MATKKYPKGVFMDIPEFKTAREFIENGHLKGGDNKQYIYMETAKSTRTKSFNEVWYDSTGLGQFLYKHGMNEKKVADLSKKYLSAISTGKMSAMDAIKKLGASYEGAMKKIFFTGSFEGNAESTKKRKKSSRPLIDTGLLRQSIKYKVAKI